MSNRHVFEYAVLRCVPRVDRGECMNIGVLVYCQHPDYLSAASHIDEQRLRVLDPAVDIDAVRAAAHTVQLICAGDDSAGPAAAGSPGVRFRWLTAPRSTIVQPGPVHTGLTDNPDRELAHLLDRLVR